MKKPLLVIVTLAVLSLGLHYWDKATRVKAKTALPGNTVLKADNPNSDLPEPELTLKDLDGKDVSLSQYKGKVVLVNFWATWCQPCRVEIPWLIEFDKKYGPQGLVILGVAMDDDGKKAVEPWVKAHQFDVEAKLDPLNRPAVSGN